ncbi:uncharacterized protein isoform X2 [Takifugu rubripes]|uniref:uncharacterized protein isoform X2 n=1 Tax=Takifugu rubripes TaxID=31033 RepID=UPI001145F444|nr:uncharacterized protein LOC101076164 isoform X2 [Takifugu rubripes]
MRMICNFFPPLCAVLQTKFQLSNVDIQKCSCQGFQATPVCPASPKSPSFGPSKSKYSRQPPSTGFLANGKRKRCQESYKKNHEATGSAQRHLQPSKSTQETCAAIACMDAAATHYLGFRSQGS